MCILSLELFSNVALTPPVPKVAFERWPRNTGNEGRSGARLEKPARFTISVAPGAHTLARRRSASYTEVDVRKDTII